MLRGKFIISICTFSFLLGCSSYQTVPHSIQDARAYTNTKATSGSVTFATAPYYSDSKLNFPKAGVLPIRLIVSNHGKKNVNVNPGTFQVVTSQGNFTPYTANAAADRVINASEAGVALGGIAEGLLIGAGIGAVSGVAIGAIAGGVGKGAILGTAIGGTAGGIAGGVKSTDELKSRVRDEFRDVVCKDMTVPPGGTLDCVVFAPANGVTALEITSYGIKVPAPSSYLDDPY